MSEDAVPYISPPGEDATPTEMRDWSTHLDRIDALLIDSSISKAKRERLVAARRLIEKAIAVRAAVNQRLVTSGARPAPKGTDDLGNAVPSDNDIQQSSTSPVRSSGASKRRPASVVFNTLMAIAIFLGLPAAYFGWQAYEAALEEERRRIADSATELPDGVRHLWLETLERALEHRLALSGRRVRFTGRREIAYVHDSQINVICNAQGVRLESGGLMGDADGAVRQHLAYLVATDPNRYLAAGALQVPPLEVGSRSPAAQALFNEACELTAAALR